ncbi:MAG: proton-conducting transporter membrane subunit [Gemmatimonadaceae bacterium]
MTLFLLGLALLMMAGGSAIAGARAWAGRVYTILAVAGCAIGAIDPARVLLTGASASLSIPAALPGGEWRLGIDVLSAVFLVLVLGVGAACAVFGSHDLARTSRRHGFTHLTFAALVAAIALVVAARSVVAFLGAWEVMAIASYLLIVTDHERPDARRAGLIYIVATHTATLALFAMFAIWAAPASDWSFATLAATSSSLDAGKVAAILLLALFGFGFKAGCVPLHFWLPPAHASAPSHVSALMSGIVIKTGIYGLLRVLLMLGGAPAWWGWLVFWIGIASAVLGVLWALAQHDVKRLLAYHSVENIGIIFIGIGVGVLGREHGLPGVAALGFVGGLLHTVNHALFKSLLFLGAGAVYRAAGTRNMEALGGLARRMPLTWLGFVVGAAAIIGVPPFNGFVSEWLVYQGMFAGADAQAPLRAALLGLPALALVGALALACFAKVAGVVFLGTPRSESAAGATEVGRGAHVPMFALALACIALGVVPRLGVDFVSGGALALTGPGASVPDSVLAATSTISLLAVGMLVGAAALWWVRGILRERHVVRRDVTWACGYDAVTPRMQYTASSFAAPLLSIFGKLSGVRVARSRRALHTEPIDLVLDAVAIPLWHSLHRIALRLHATHHGRLHLYLLYIMAALLAMLAYLSLAPR